MKPKRFSALNHFTVPVSSTAMPEDTDADLEGFHRILPAEAAGDARFGLDRSW
jgi:hypothetical protein